MYHIAQARIISVRQSITIRKKGKKIVLVGGCFDVLHPGHVVFLEESKKLGDLLVVLLESDQKVRVLKGANRPAYTQMDRAKILQALRCVDFVVTLPFIKDKKEYDLIIQTIGPDIIATTKGYENINHHIRIAKSLGINLKYVTRIIGNYSSSRIINWGLDKPKKIV